MESEILKLVYDYSVNKKFVDMDFVTKVIGIVVLKRNLKDYVQFINFTDELAKNEEYITVATYDQFIGEICVDFEAIQIVKEQIFKKYKYLFSELEQFMSINLKITQCILHELEHAKQLKCMENKLDNSIETKLLRSSNSMVLTLRNPKIQALFSSGKLSCPQIDDHINRCNKLYVEYYDLCPEERFADIDSCKTVINIVEQIKTKVSKLYGLVGITLSEKLLSGYTDDSCPTQEYLFGVGQNRLWYRFDFYSPNQDELLKKVSSQYDLSQRLSLGLPISSDEYNEISDSLSEQRKLILK